jgi:hypothetical protein
LHRKDFSMTRFTSSAALPHYYWFMVVAVAAKLEEVEPGMLT